MCGARCRPTCQRPTCQRPTCRWLTCRQPTCRWLTCRRATCRWLTCRQPSVTQASGATFVTLIPSIRGDYRRRPRSRYRVWLQIKSEYAGEASCAAGVTCRSGVPRQAGWRQPGDRHDVTSWRLRCRHRRRGGAAGGAAGAGGAGGVRAEPPLAGPALAGRQLTPESHTHVATYTLFVCGHTLFCARCHIHAFGAGACEAGVMNVASEACGGCAWRVGWRARGRLPLCLQFRGL
jgi:hypothetical protein